VSCSDRECAGCASFEQADRPLQQQVRCGQLLQWYCWRFGVPNKMQTHTDAALLFPILCHPHRRTLWSRVGIPGFGLTRCFWIDLLTGWIACFCFAGPPTDSGVTRRQARAAEPKVAAPNSRCAPPPQKEAHLLQTVIPMSGSSSGGGIDNRL